MNNLHASLSFKTLFITYVLILSTPLFIHFLNAIRTSSLCKLRFTLLQITGSEEVLSRQENEPYPERKALVQPAC